MIRFSLPLLFLLLASQCLSAAQPAEPPVPELPKVFIDTTWDATFAGKTLKPKNADGFQAALDSAAPGDTILLQAGSTYSGNFTLPAKNNPGHKWIYIVSSAMSDLPSPGTRVDPKDAPKMPKIVTPNVKPALTLEKGASHYRLAGLELTSNSTQGCKEADRPINCFSYQLIFAESEIGAPMVDSITIDRCFLHGSPTQDVREGVMANGTNFAVIDSYISDIHHSTFDSQAILAFRTPGPIKIVNNFLSATTENVMFGGAGGKDNPYVPSDIEIRNNYFFKPLEWAAVGVTIPPKNQWVEKNSLEFKSGRRVLVDGNLLENTWKSGQIGFSIVLTVRSGQSGDAAVVNDITITNNILKNVAQGFNTLNQDYNCGSPSSPNCTSAGETRRVKIANNLVLFRSPDEVGGVRNVGIMLNYGISDYVLQHNSFIPAAGTNCWNSVFFTYKPKEAWPPTQSTTHNVWVLDNVLCKQPTGDHGAKGSNGLEIYMGDPPPMDRRFVGNLIAVPDGDKEEFWPARNSTTGKVPGMVVSRANEFQLNYPDFTKTTDGLPAGVDKAKLKAALLAVSGTTSGGSEAPAKSPSPRASSADRQ